MNASLRSVLLVLAGALLTFTEAAAQAESPEGKKKKPKAEARPGVVFSHPPGFYDQPLALRLSHPDEEAVIYYTLDGSEPDPGNVGGSTYRYKNLYSYRASDPFGPFLEHRVQTHLYQGAITVDDRSSAPDRYSRINTTILSGLPRYFPPAQPLSPAKQKANDWIARANRGVQSINGWWSGEAGDPAGPLPALPAFEPPEPNHLLKGTVVRAAAFRKGEALGPVTTASYFVMPRSTFQLPVVSLVAPEERLFGYDRGILVAGVAHDRFRQENPTQQRAMGNSPGNWLARGKDAEVPAHLHFFSHTLSPQQASIDQAVGIRVHGGINRAAPSKSLRIYARKEYGKATLEHAFFGREEKFKRLLLRNSGNDFYTTMMRDAAIQRILAGLRFDVQDYQPSVVFMNGEYWGLLNLREYMDKHFLAREHGVDEDRLDIMDLNEADEGDDAHWRALMEYATAHPLSEERHYRQVAQWVDIDNFIDYIIAQVFVVNYDWPHNNVRRWRLRTTPGETPSSPAHDGRWRWLVFDTDAGFRDHKPDALDRLVAVNPRYNSETAELFRRLLKNRQFQQAFVVRFSDLLNTTFRTDRMQSVISGVRAGIADEMPRHIQRWAHPASLEEWEKVVKHYQNFAGERPALQRQQLARFFKLPGEYRLTVNVSDSAHGRVRVNTTTLDETTHGVTESVYPWSGTYFQRVPLEVEAVAAPCHAFSHWQGHARKEPRIVVRPTSDVSLTAVFQRTCAGS